MKISQLPKNPLSLFLILGGVGLIILAFALDFLGFSNPKFIGINQIYFFLLGSVSCLFGIYTAIPSPRRKTLEKKFNTKFIRFAVVTTRFLVFLFLLETLLLLSEMDWVMKWGFSPDPLKNLNAYYLNPADSLGKSVYHYSPYVVYRHSAYKSATTNINKEGIRFTPGSECHDNSYKIFVFGASIIYGSGTSDGETLPAHLQRILSAKLNYDVCVINYGTNAWNPTQEMILLMKELQAGRIPQLVIFGDGDSLEWRPKEHEFAQAFEEFFKNHEEERSDSLFRPLTTTRTYRLLKNHLFPEKTESLTPEILSEGVKIATQHYLTNVKIVKGMRKEFNFEVLFVWYPHHKNLADDPLFIETNETLTRALKNDRNFVSVIHLLDDKEGPLWTGDLGHLLDEGNRILAEELFKILQARSMLPASYP